MDTVAIQVWTRLQQQKVVTTSNRTSGLGLLSKPNGPAKGGGATTILVAPAMVFPAAKADVDHPNSQISDWPGFCGNTVAKDTSIWRWWW